MATLTSGGGYIWFDDYEHDWSNPTTGITASGGAVSASPSTQGAAPFIVFDEVPGGVYGTLTNMAVTVRTRVQATAGSSRQLVGVYPGLMLLNFSKGWSFNRTLLQALTTTLTNYSADGAYPGSYWSGAAAFGGLSVGDIEPGLFPVVQLEFAANANHVFELDWVEMVLTYDEALSGQPMQLRATTVPGLRQWQPRGLR